MGSESVGLAGVGISMPERIVSAGELAEETGIPADVLRRKFGVRQVHRAGPDEHVSDMGIAAGRAALDAASVSPGEVDLVVYCGSEHKDFIVWSAASAIAYGLGCDRAEAYEVYALCAGAPITLRIVKDMMLAEPEIRTALVVAASRESELVDRGNGRTRFMFNFGDGASAAVVQRGLDRNLLLGSASITDGSLSRTAVMPAGGSRRRASHETVEGGEHYLDVPDIAAMRDRLEEVSGPNFLNVIRTALARSNRDQVHFLGAVHMKRSMQDWLCAELGSPRTVYLEDYGHMQAADQFVILHQAQQQDLLRDGDTVVLAAAGVGYTWSASVLGWGSGSAEKE